MTQAQSEFSAAISSVEEIIEDARQGRMYILVDHEDRENEGDICIAAEKCTPDVINFMATHGRGLICLTLTGDRIDQLGLPMMAMKNSSRHETAFTVSIEAVEGVETGISAKDRALTVAVAIDKTKGKADLATPGHVFPLRARDGGVLVRAGHTEAAVDVSRLAGLDPSGVICEVMKDDGTMARLPDLIAFGQKHGIKIGTISDLIAYRRRHDNLIKEREAKRVTSVHGGDWLMRVFTDTAHGDDHIVLSKGDLSGDVPVLVRMHQLNPLEDALGIGSAPVGDLQGAMQVIAAEGRGVVVLLRDTTLKLPLAGEVSPQTLRLYGLGAQILASLGLTHITLVSNSAAPRVVGLDAYGITITGTRRIKD
jgi:3,4-dihydroxy 2-butanone 4-phosphate synthase/GTP cyclohydrolase II